MNKLKLQIRVLSLSQSFDTLWAYYSLSSGELYYEICKKEAIRLLNAIRMLAKLDRDILDAKELKIGDKSDINAILEQLASWAQGKSSYSSERLVARGWMMRVFLCCLRNLILKKLNIKERPMFVLSSLEEDHSMRIMRWKPHLPRRALIAGPDKIVNLASDSLTIVVVGDIRRSQDLMTYATDPIDFSKRIVEFFNTTRQFVEKHAGVFDKFTGDGFIVYFNEEVSKIAELDFIECFLNFIKDEMSFAVPFFTNWERSIRKRPIKNIGLAIGADIGKIRFEDIQNHLVVVGDAVVWATRMASAADSQEVLLNNLLYSALDGRKNIAFEKREGQTKAGEPFLSQIMKFI
ncbi:MAG: adenylate/guanylate cyclase domain-containing protein [Desulfobaccales bacterium]